MSVSCTVLSSYFCCYCPDTLPPASYLLYCYMYSHQPIWTLSNVLSREEQLPDSCICIQAKCSKILSVWLVRSVKEYLFSHIFSEGFSGGSAVKNLHAIKEMREMQFRSLDQEDPLEEEMPTCSSVLAWRIPWTEELGITKSRTRLSD